MTLPRPPRGMPTFLARASGTFAWKSANWEGRSSGSASRSSGWASPKAAAMAAVTRGRRPRTETAWPQGYGGCVHSEDPGCRPPRGHCRHDRSLALPQASPALGGTREPAETVAFGEPAAPIGGKLPPDIATHFPHGTEAGWRPGPERRRAATALGTGGTGPSMSAAGPDGRGAKAAPPVRTKASGLGAHRLLAVLAFRILASCVTLLWWIATLNTLQIWSLQPGEVHERTLSLRGTMILIILALLLVVFTYGWVFVMVLGRCRPRRPT